MGLDAVELLITVEEAFGIRIEDGEASGVTTVGGLHSLVVGKLAGRAPRGCFSSAAFYALRRSLIGLFDVPRETVTLQQRMADLVPATDRWAHWDRLGQSLGLRLPATHPPAGPLWATIWVGCGLITSCYLGVVDALYLKSVHVPEYATLALLIGVALWAFVLARITAPIELPANCLTVRDTVATMLRLNYGAISPEGHQWTEAQVWERLQALVVEQLSVKPDEVVPTARFVEDLRMD